MKRHDERTQRKHTSSNTRLYTVVHTKTLDLNSSLDIVLNKDTSNTFVLSLYILKHKPQMLIDKSLKNTQWYRLY